MSKLDKMQKQLEAIQRQIAQEKKRLKDIEAKDRKRRIDIIGTYYLELAEKKNTLDQMAATLDQAGLLKRKTDRFLFGLDNKVQNIPKAQPATPMKNASNE